MIRNILLTIQYDGTKFCGWQRQPEVVTVQGELERVLCVICADDIEINGTSRTDAGVHAIGQCANFLGDFAIPTEKIKFAANNMLDPAIQIVDVKEMPLDFHARFDCKGKTYEYRIQNGDYKNPFLRDFSYFVRKPLDIERMQKAASYIVGKHDFKCFQASGGYERKTTVRTISDIKVRATDESGRVPSVRDIRIEVTGDGFLYNMVRIIAGTLVDIGLGRLEPEHIKEIIDKRDRRCAGHTASPQGLYLKKIYFK